MKNLLLLIFFFPLMLSAQDFFWHKNTIGVELRGEVNGLSSNRFGGNFALKTGKGGYSFGTRLQFPISRKLFLRTGMTMSQRYFRFQEFDFFNTDVFFDGPFGNLPSNRRVFFDVLEPNGTDAPLITDVKLSTADIPIVLGFMIPRKKVNWYFTYGFIYHLYLAERVVSEPQGADPALNLRFIERKGTDLSNSNVSIQMGAGLAVKLNPAMQFYVETNFLGNLGSVQLVENFFENYNGLGLSMGFNFVIN